jgi:hypothetical protein
MTEPIVATSPPAGGATPPPPAPPAGGTPPPAASATPPPSPADGKTLLGGGNSAEIKYELKLPENAILEATSLGEIETFAKAHGLPEEKAQALVDFQNKWLAESEAKERLAQEKQAKEWVAEIQADPVLGGENLKKNVELSNRLIKRFDTDGSFVQLLGSSGLGNHKAMFGIMARIASAMGEDTLVHGRTPGATSPAAGTDAAMAQTMFNTK